MHKVNLEIKDESIIKILDFLRIRSKKVRRFIGGTEDFFDRVDHNHLFLLSSGIAFTIILYLIPLLLVAIYLVKIIFGIGSLTTLIIDTLQAVLPPNEQTTELVKTIVSEAYTILDNSSLAGMIGIITLIWLSSTLFSSLRTGLNTVFKIEAKQFFIIYRLRDMLLIVVLAILILLSSYVFPILSLLTESLMEALPSSLSYLLDKLFPLFTLLVSFILFYLLYRFVPTTRTPRQIRVISTLMCVFMIEIARHGFAYYLSGVTAYGRFYGTYAIMALMALWIYYLTTIILLSAELSKFIYDLRNSKKEELRGESEE
jgi:membrane protein